MSENKNRYTGRVIEVGQTENVSKNAAKPFYKRCIVVDDTEIGAKYPNPVSFEATGDKCEYLDKYKVGDIVTVEFYLNGRAWEDPKTKKTRYFTANRIGYISLASEAEAEGGDAGAADATADGGDVADDMPF